jgi:acetylornithine deacetylase/succinyl-diaminopimelate desuccinylase-like protein
MNIGAIHGGTAPNIVPAKCSAFIDIRYVPGLSRGQIEEELRKMAQAAAARTPGSRTEITVHQDLPPTEVDPELPLVRLIQKHTKQMFGFEAQPSGMCGATLAKQLIARGIPAVGFSCGDEDKSHTSDESIAISEILDFAKLLSAIALDL